MPNNCPQLHQELETIKTLKQEFSSALDEAVKTGNLEKAEKLKEELENKILSLREKLHVSVDRAKEILGEDAVFGPKETEKAFGFLPENVPPIPFKKEDLERAKELNQQLVLYIDKTKDSKPFTGKELFGLTGNKTSDKKELFYDTDWYQNEKFFTEETPRAGWKLVSKETIPNSTSKNYLEQTETIINHLKNEVFKDKPIPEIYQEAIAEFESQKSDISKIIDSDWRSAADKLEKLQITKLTRESPIEVLYRLALNEKTNKERLLNNRYTWTLRRHSGGEFVDVGNFDDDGANVHGSRPDYRNDRIGVSFSRSV